MKAEMGERIQFLCPLPPPALRSNNRAHWRTKAAVKIEYSAEVHIAWIECWPACDSDAADSTPWKAATVTYTWRYCGTAPDKGNLGANTKALQDILCMAPKTTQENHTTYLGLVEDDKGIDPVYRLEKVARRASEGVMIEIVRRDD